jgi:signal transduction histidine kinase
VTALVRRARRLSPATVDALLAAAIGVPGLIEFIVRLPADDRSPAAGIALAAAFAALAWRRSRPLPAAAAMFALIVVMNVALVSLKPLNAPLFAVLVMSWSLGRHVAGRRAAAGSLALVIGAMTIVIATMESQHATDFLFPITFAVIVWVAGRAVRTRSQLTAELHEAAVRAEEEHEAELVRAAAGERRRIARELHDVVAHSVSVMVVQAGGARRILRRDPARAADAAVHIEETGRAALVEMRRLLGMLGSYDETRAPQPTLAEIGALVERSRAAGLPVDLTVHGEPRALPAGVDLAAYRVVQEGLTNVLRHAEGSPTDITVRWAADALELAVADRGIGAVDPDGDGGHGLVGMRERVRLYGGELWTGQREGGGFEIRARIPLEPEVAHA